MIFMELNKVLNVNYFYGTLKKNFGKIYEIELLGCKLVDSTEGCVEAKKSINCVCWIEKILFALNNRIYLDLI